MVKINDANNYESIKVVITKDKFPILFKEKVDELVEDCDMSQKEAEEFVEGMELELELYYEKSSGLFGIEAEAVESYGDLLYSPYTGKHLVNPHEDESYLKYDEEI